MTSYFNAYLDKPLTYLKGVGPAKAELLKKERGFTIYGDLLYDFPFRYEDRTKILCIRDIESTDSPVQARGRLGPFTVMGKGRKRRLISYLEDDTGAIELVWFRGVDWVQSSLAVGKEYIAYGTPQRFQQKLNLPHPEMNLYDASKLRAAHPFAPVYESTESLNRKGLGMKARRRIIQGLVKGLAQANITENMPAYLMKKLHLVSRQKALHDIHLPENQADLDAARWRLKFEELFFTQWVMVKQNLKQKRKIRGASFGTIGQNFMNFYDEHLPFTLTGAQQRVLKEIRRDMKAGYQMNRLLQGDVGSGKTIVALLSALIAIDNGYQACIMAPTEILARQHHISVSEYLKEMNVTIAFLSGSVKGQARQEILADLEAGKIDILIGTHALIQPFVQFKNLGLAITDEQHRFGVKQRAALWEKNPNHPPHVLVMTATPIPRTLAMTLYGDLDVSSIDELPPGRQPVKTLHVRDGQRMETYDFIRKQIHQGRQVYIVYPLIEESTKMQLRDLMNGYERLMEYFPRPQYQLSMVHGQMKAEEKEAEMQKFLAQKTQIMVATTVIEVGVNVPNATVMLIENAERFGLSQLHQLRGRVGRGAEKSFCILMTDFALSKDAKKRMETMCSTNDGFKISEVDLELRGPGEMAGTRQSGDLGLKLAKISEDQDIVALARKTVNLILKKDPDLMTPAHRPIARYMETEGRSLQVWSIIS
jgi:ATP-dependent DNA helicase RecG